MMPRADTIPRNGSARFDLVVFDMEGTLTDSPTLWEIMHVRNGTWESHGQPYWEQFKRGVFGYDEFARKDVAAWRGAALSLLDASVEDVPLMPGCSDVLRALHAQGIRTAIISNGLERLGLRLAREFGIARVEANREAHRDGVLTGELDVRVPYDAKGRILRDMAQEMGVAPERVLAVGDGVADVAMFERAGRSIAFAPEHAGVARAADHVIAERDLRRILEWIG